MSDALSCFDTLCCLPQVEQFDVSLDGFLEKLANLSDTVSSIIGEDGPRPGQLAAKKGIKAHHPVVIVPGEFGVMTSQGMAPH
jgi:hypothetical protein